MQFGYLCSLKQLLNEIREWRQAGGAQSAMLGASHVVEDQMPSPTILSSRKKPKMNHSLPSQSFGAPSPQFHAQVVAASNQPSSSAAKRGSMMSSKGKKNRSVSQILFTVLGTEKS